MNAPITATSQRPLDFPGPFQPRLDNFIVGHNAALLKLLQQQAAQPQGWHYLRAPAACGKTHLLWATQALALQNGLDVVYLQVGSGAEQLNLLQQLTDFDLLLLDRAGQLSAAHNWQQPLFDCLQRAQLQQRAVIMAGRETLAGLRGVLADLHSRLATMSQHQLRAVGDADRAALVRHFMQRYHLPIEDDVLAYLLSRSQREQQQLLQLLQGLVDEVLQTGQRLTRPLLRRHLNISPPIS